MADPIEKTERTSKSVLLMAAVAIIAVATSAYAVGWLRGNLAGNIVTNVDTGPNVIIVEAPVDQDGDGVPDSSDDMPDTALYHTRHPLVKNYALLAAPAGEWRWPVIFPSWVRDFWYELRTNISVAITVEYTARGCDTVLSFTFFTPTGLLPATYRALCMSPGGLDKLVEVDFHPHRLRAMSGPWPWSALDVEAWA